MRSLFPLLISLSLISSPALAEDNCSKSKYKLLDDTIPFGTTQANTLTKLQAKYTGKGRAFSPGQNFVVVEFSKPVNNLKSIAYRFTGGVMTRVMFEYSIEFISSLGGTMSLFKALYPKLKEKYGEHDDVENIQEDDQARFAWNENNGLSMHLIITGYTSVSFRFDCDSLERTKEQEATKSANFGF
jgi:hypothetical protein